MKIVMFNHNIPPSDDYVISFDLKKLDLKQHNLIAWVFDHYHYNYIEENSGVLNISTARPDCGGIDSSVSGARMINIAEDGSITTEMTYYDFRQDITAVPDSVWETSIAGNVLFCDPLFDSGKIYIASVDEDYPRTCGIYCLDTSDGSIIWNCETENSVKNKLVLSDGRLIAQDCSGNVYCLNCENGNEMWKTTVALGSSLNTSSGICVSDGMVYTGCAAAVTALDINTDRTVWENIRNKGEASPAEFVITGNKLIVSSHWDSLTSLDKATGKKLWENKDGDLRFRSSTPAAIDESTLIAADSNAIMIINSNTGEIIKTIDIGVPVFGSVCNYENNIYVADFSGRVVCLENF